ncbi:zinc-finger domain-containing protein [Candidatus Liberibacter sp.]|uniref:zinc-finger domain-containing protein n=1 Tax=Candidatus Liberibacter sp. TaxID=34022 RepID=UPI0015F66EF3|nr:zinc-finger domain-containing protein [Candidatus Liberibacter sp.]MBA5724120.1 zinc-finger domain-containing protein [Candidatus Liberibacter sp.]
MEDRNVPHFQNDIGHHTIEIGVKKFMCIGSSPPLDHPHIFINLGKENEKVCPYCSTLYRFNASLNLEQTVPEGCFLSP